jgi:hypothetical protein
MDTEASSAKHVLKLPSRDRGSFEFVVHQASGSQGGLDRSFNWQRIALAVPAYKGARVGLDSLVPAPCGTMEEMARVSYQAAGLVWLVLAAPVASAIIEA